MVRYKPDCLERSDMLPKQTTTPEAEVRFAERLKYLSVVWMVATIAAGVGLILLRPWMQGLF